MLDFILKPMLLLASAMAVDIIHSPPVPPPKEKELARPNTFSERFVLLIASSNKIIIWALIICELTILLFASFRPPPFLLCPNPSPTVLFQHIHPFLALGGVIIIISAALRLWCYKTMGRLYTFQVVIRNNHQLITNGPYAWVRHPGYAALYLLVLGEAAMLLSPEGWMVGCGSWKQTGIIIWAPWLLNVFVMVNAVFQRLGVEDGNLRELFKSQWDAYAARVPYMLVPGII
ncbi:hypothetical protein BD779DRAFT_1013484 [Infundibulicybe gibba]|nr:hypothetical protein BD779DRAFT_1013484 [Infundibulicybe gibba]